MKRLMLCIIMLAALPLYGQSTAEQQIAILDSLRAESCRGGAWHETAKAPVCRGSSLAPRKEEIRRWEARLRVLVLEGMPVPETPPPPPDASIAIIPNADTLRQRPASPHNVFVLIRVDSGGATVGDSADLTASGDANAKVWWNGQARRYEVYDASKGGTLVLTAVRGSAAASITLPVVTSSTPSTPPTTPPDTSTPTPPTPPTNPTPPASAAAALAKIGPTISRLLPPR